MQERQQPMADFINQECSRRSVLCAAMGAAIGFSRPLMAQAETAGQNHPGKKGHLRVAIIPAGEPHRTADELFRTSAEMGFEAVQCVIGIDAGWLRAHPPAGPETGPLLARRIASCSARGGQFHLDPDRPDETVRAIQALCRKHRLAVSCLYTGFQAHWLDVLAPMAACAQALGCKTIKLDGSSGSSERGKVFGQCAGYRQWLDVSRARLREALAALRAYDVRLIFETHPWVITRNAQSCARLLEGFDPQRVGILLDVANLWFEGNEPIEVAVDLLRGYIAQLHVKNVAVEVRREAGHGGAVVKNVRLADGVVDWPYVLRVLNDAGFAGDAAIECFAASILGRNDPQAVDALLRSEKEVFCRWAQEAGMWRPR